MTTPRGPGQRAGLSRDAVLGAARLLLAEDGLERLTMRAIADALGVAPNALYSHVASKSAMVDDLLDGVLAAVAAPSGDDPATGLREVMASTYDVLIAHADLVPVYLARQGSRGPNAQRLGVIMNDLLGRAGLEGTAVGEARRVLIVYAIGFAAFSTPGGTDPAAVGVEPARANFNRGLGWLVDGIIGAD